jgi:cytochrome P450
VSAEAAIQPLIDLQDPDVARDPYPHYRRLLREQPVYHTEHGFWLLTRYDHVDSLLRDRRLGRQGFTAGMRSRYGDGPLFEMFSRGMNFLDPPDHKRIRSLVSRAFTPKTVQTLRPRIHSLVRGLLAELLPQGEMDVVRDFAYPLPIAVICEILGVPEADRPRVQRPAAEVSAAVDPAVDEQTLAVANEAMAEILDYFGGLIAERRRRPREDLLSQLIAVESDGAVLTDAELLSTVVLLFGAGHETTKALIAQGLVALVENPSQLALLRQKPELLPDAVDEMLRYDPPTQIAGRLVMAELELDGHRFSPGDRLALCIGAANRDPDRFADPDAFAVERPDKGRLSFGGGIHFCLGADLARTESTIAFGELLRRIRRFELDEAGVRWRPTLVMRSPEAVPIGFEAA